MKRIITLIITFITSCTLLVGTLIFYNSNGFDCTDEYEIYKSVCDKTTVQDVTDELEKSKANYTINNLKLTVDDYKNISFDVDTNGYCTVCENELMEGFKILDKKDLNKITVQGVYNKSTASYEEVYSYFPSYKVVLANGKYTGFSKIMINVFLIIIIILVLAIIIITSLLAYYICMKIKNSKNKISPSGEYPYIDH